MSGDRAQTQYRVYRVLTSLQLQCMKEIALITCCASRHFKYEKLLEYKTVIPAETLPVQGSWETLCDRFHH